jgi:hypothetical protein
MLVDSSDSAQAIVGPKDEVESAGLRHVSDAARAYAGRKQVRTD